MGVVSAQTSGKGILHVWLLIFLIYNFCCLCVCVCFSRSRTVSVWKCVAFRVDRFIKYGYYRGQELRYKLPTDILLGMLLFTVQR